MSCRHECILGYARPMKTLENICVLSLKNVKKKQNLKFLIWDIVTIDRLEGTWKLERRKTDSGANDCHHHTKVVRDRRLGQHNGRWKGTGIRGQLKFSKCGSRYIKNKAGRYRHSECVGNGRPITSWVGQALSHVRTGCRCREKYNWRTADFCRK